MAKAIAPTPGANKLFDQIKAEYSLKNDASLSRALDVTPAALSKMRHGRIAVGDTMILFLHERFDIPIREIKAQLAGTVA